MEETKTTVTETKQEDKGLSQIQPNEKKSWWSIAFIWVGTMICIPMLMVGGIFGGTLTMGSIFWATLIGFAICCLLMIMGGIVGADTGLNAQQRNINTALRWYDRCQFYHGTGRIYL